MERKPAPKNATCCKCSQPIPEGQDCWQKTVQIGSMPSAPANLSIEQVLPHTTPYTAFLCLKCAEES